MARANEFITCTFTRWRSCCSLDCHESLQQQPLHIQPDSIRGGLSRVAHMKPCDVILNISGAGADAALCTTSGLRGSSSGLTSLWHWLTHMSSSSEITDSSLSFKWCDMMWQDLALQALIWLPRHVAKHTHTRIHTWSLACNCPANANTHYCIHKMYICFVVMLRATAA